MKYVRVSVGIIITLKYYIIYLYYIVGRKNTHGEG